jgi:hypothetical protein
MAVRLAPQLFGQPVDAHEVVTSAELGATSRYPNGNAETSLLVRFNWMFVSLHIRIIVHMELVSGIKRDSLNPPDDGVTKKTVPPPGPVSPTTQVPPCAHERAEASAGLVFKVIGTETARALTPTTVAARKIRRKHKKTDISMNITVLGS